MDTPLRHSGSIGKLRRRDFLALAGGAAGLTVASRMAHAAAPEGRLNVVIIATDDNDADMLGCYGCPLPDITPNMDALAASGVRFTNAHNVSPTCQPSRLALMTGRYPQTNGNTGHCDPLTPGVPTLALELKNAGYYTALVGKEPNYIPYESFAWDRHGLTADTWDDASDGYWSMWRSPEGFYKGTRELVAEARAGGKPFFLHLNTSDPHRPWPGSVDEVDLLRSTKGWETKKLRPYSRNYSPQEVPIPPYLPDLTGVRVDLGQFYSALHNADKAIGRMLDALREEGAEENTIIICYGDNGAPFPPSKQNLYRFSTRTPLLIRWPGVTAPGGTPAQLAATIDIMPTLLEGLGLPPAPGMDGRSILPILRGEQGGGRDCIHTSYTYAYPGIQAFPMRAVQDTEFLFIYNSWPGESNIRPAGKLKYDGHIEPLTGLCWKSMKEAAEKDPELAKRVAFIRDRAPEEFYDLRDDPWCLNNRIAAPEHAERIARMRGMVEAQMVAVNDPLLAKFQGTGPIPPAWLEYTGKV